MNWFYVLLILCLIFGVWKVFGTILGIFFNIVLIVAIIVAAYLWFRNKYRDPR